MFKRLIYRLTQITAGLLFKVLSAISYSTFGFLFFRLSIKNKKVPNGLRGPMIIAPSHKSYVDSFFILAALPVNSRLLPARTLVVNWVFEMPVLGWAVKNLLGAYRVRKKKSLGLSIREILSEPLEFLQKGGVVGIYPEGGLGLKPGVHEVKTGAAYLAQKSGAPVLPVAIRGIDYFSWKAFFFGRRRVEVVFGNPFLVDGAKDVKEISGEIRRKIAELYGQPRAIRE